MEIIRNVVKNSTPPENKIDGWLSVKKDKLRLKFYNNGEWMSIGDTDNILEYYDYATIRNLISNKDLISGKYYIIKDYCTKVNDSNPNIRSMEYKFDILVYAISKDTFSEDAYAVASKDDDYFTPHSKMMWKIKYCFYNDIERFDWASSEGKGVIYYMEDEYGNKAGYDFKSIQFFKNKYWHNSYKSYLAYNPFMPPDIYDELTKNGVWYYTFSQINLETFETIDCSLYYDNSKEEFKDKTISCTSNIIENAYKEINHIRKRTIIPNIFICRVYPQSPIFAYNSIEENASSVFIGICTNNLIESNLYNTSTNIFIVDGSSNEIEYNTINTVIEGDNNITCRGSSGKINGRNNKILNGISDYTVIGNNNILSTGSNINCQGNENKIYNIRNVRIVGNSNEINNLSDSRIYGSYNKIQDTPDRNALQYDISSNIYLGQSVSGLNLKAYHNTIVGRDILVSEYLKYTTIKNCHTIEASNIENTTIENSYQIEANSISNCTIKSLKKATIGNNFYNNTVDTVGDDRISNIVIGDECKNNILKNISFELILGNNCKYNTIEHCFKVTLSNNTLCNIIKHSNNIIHKYSSDNINIINCKNIELDACNSITINNCESCNFTETAYSYLCNLHNINISLATYVTLNNCENITIGDGGLFNSVADNLKDTSIKGPFYNIDFGKNNSNIQLFQYVYNPDTNTFEEGPAEFLQDMTFGNNIHNLIIYFNEHNRGNLVKNITVDSNLHDKSITIDTTEYNNDLNLNIIISDKDKQKILI